MAIFFFVLKFFFNYGQFIEAQSSIYEMKLLIQIYKNLIFKETQTKKTTKQNIVRSALVIRSKQFKLKMPGVEMIPSKNT